MVADLGRQSVDMDRLCRLLSSRDLLHHPIRGGSVSTHPRDVPHPDGQDSAQQFRGAAVGVAFQAFTISAASRVGVGNIAGVGTAIAVGGPGAVFWMWVMAFIGGASSFIESSLAQLFKVRDKDSFRGGPAYYMQRGLKARWLGVWFAIILIICFPFAFSSLQANTISATVTSSVGGDLPWLPWGIGLGIAVLTGLVVFGGVRRIASVTQILVPIMALAYLLLGLIVVGLHVDRIGPVFAEIFTQAWGFNEVVGAAFGYIVLTGVKRGMFSNEAGLGPHRTRAPAPR